MKSMLRLSVPLLFVKEAVLLSRFPKIMRLTPGVITVLMQLWKFRNREHTVSGGVARTLPNVLQARAFMCMCSGIQKTHQVNQLYPLLSRFLISPALYHWYQHIPLEPRNRIILVIFLAP